MIAVVALGSMTACSSSKLYDNEWPFRAKDPFEDRTFDTVRAADASAKSASLKSDSSKSGLSKSGSGESFSRKSF